MSRERKYTFCRVSDRLTVTAVVLSSSLVKLFFGNSLSVSHRNNKMSMIFLKLSDFLSSKRTEKFPFHIAKDVLILILFAFYSVSDS